MENSDWESTNNNNRTGLMESKHSLGGTDTDRYILNGNGEKTLTDFKLKIENSGNMCASETSGTKKAFQKPLPRLIGTHKTVFVQGDTTAPPKLTTGKLVGILSGLFLMFSGIVSFIYTPADMALRERTKMLPGLPPFDWWADPPDEVRLKVYLFNVTNSKEFLAGIDSKLKMEEVGPFVFSERLQHTDVVFNGNGTLTYTANRTAVFLPHLSNNLTMQTKLLVPNLPLLAGASYVSTASFLTRLGFNVIVRRLKSQVFVELTAEEMMWNWKEPLVGVASTFMPSLVPVDNLGILQRVYSDFIDEVTVYMGPENAKKFFLIDKFHGSSRLNWWPGERCDNVVGSTEGVSYPQHLTRNDSVKYLRKTICRVAELFYEKDVYQESMTAFRFELPDSLFHRPENQSDDCFTLPGDKPLPSGISDVSPCYYNFPIGVSLPHFYGGTDELINEVEGMRPTKEEHGSFVIVEPNTGIPMESRARSQCNIIVKDVSSFAGDIPKFTNRIIPLFWLEYGQQGLPGYVSWLMYAIVVIIPNTQTWVSLLFLVGGMTLLYSGFASHFAYIYRRFVFRYHKFEKLSFGYFR